MAELECGQQQLIKKTPPLIDLLCYQIWTVLKNEGSCLLYIEGYASSRLHNYAQNLEGKLLLIHGTVDDVVVMQHNLSLVKAFVDEGIQMDFFPYPMHPHNVRGKDRLHLMTKVLDYVEDHINN